MSEDWRELLSQSPRRQVSETLVLPKASWMLMKIQTRQLVDFLSQVWPESGEIQRERLPDNYYKNKLVSRRR